MINITTKPTNNTTKSSTYKINKSFNSLCNYITDYCIPECKGNVDVITKVDDLTCCSYLPTTIYSYQYGRCLPYGTIQGGSFCRNTKQVVHTRTVGIYHPWDESSSTCYICPEQCVWETFTYEYCLDTCAPTHAALNGGRLPVALGQFNVVDRLIWPCVSMLTWVDSVANPAQLSSNTWVCYGCSCIYAMITGRPIVPAGTTIGLFGTDWTMNTIGRCGCFSPGIPLWFYKDGKCFLDSFCPDWICVVTNSGGKLTLFDFNARECGANANNTLEYHLPDVIDCSLVEEKRRWLDERLQAGYVVCALMPAYWHNTWGLTPLRVRYRYCRYEATYYTIGNACYESDVNQILFKG